MLQKFKVFYVDKSNRVEAIMLCSFKNRINWVENGLGIVTWSYNFSDEIEANSLSEVYNRLKKISFDKRRKINNRTIGFGDIICFEDEGWIVTSNGF